MKKIIATLIGAALVGAALTGCTQVSEAQQERQALQEQSRQDSLEIENLKEKRERENDSSAIRYLYLMNFGQIVGYYVTQGKISSNGSQIAPEQDLIIGWDTPNAAGEELYVVDSSQDDGSYGAGDPGIFFFTTDGTMVVTSLDYIQSDQPLAIDIPRLG